MPLGVPWGRWVEINLVREHVESQMLLGRFIYACYIKLTIFRLLLVSGWLVG